MKSGYPRNHDYPSAFNDVDYLPKLLPFTSQDIDQAAGGCGGLLVPTCGGPYSLSLYCLDGPLLFLGGWAINMTTNVASFWDPASGGSPNPPTQTWTVTPEEAQELRQEIVNNSNYPENCPS